MSPIVKGGWVGGLVVPVTLALVLPLAISVMSGQPSEIKLLQIKFVIDSEVEASLMSCNHQWDVDCAEK